MQDTKKKLNESVNSVKTKTYMIIHVNLHICSNKMEKSSPSWTFGVGIACPDIQRYGDDPFKNPSPKAIFIGYGLKFLQEFLSYLHGWCYGMSHGFCERCSTLGARLILKV